MKRSIAVLIEVLLIVFFSFYYLDLFGGSPLYFSIISLFVLLFTSISSLWIYYLYQTHARWPKHLLPIGFWIGAIVLFFLIGLFIQDPWTNFYILIIVMVFTVSIILTIPFYWIVPRPKQMPRKKL